jgi:F0F1-type ATP synthase membrane subunit b/b'
MAAAAAALWAAEPAWANQAQMPEWRYWWDLAWRVVNSAILVVVLYKLAKQPLLDFLQSQKEAKTAEIQELEDKKRQALQARQELEAKTARMAEELAEQEKLLEESAARERQRLMEAAEQDSKLILERAETWAEQSLVQARQRLIAEMVEMAGDMAAEKIAEAINSDDRRRLLEEFRSQVAQAAG